MTIQYRGVTTNSKLDLNFDRLKGSIHMLDMWPTGKQAFQLQTKSQADTELSHLRVLGLAFSDHISVVNLTRLPKSPSAPTLTKETLGILSVFVQTGEPQSPQKNRCTALPLLPVPTKCFGAPFATLILLLSTLRLWLGALNAWMSSGSAWRKAMKHHLRAGGLAVIAMAGNSSI